jgi:hypothetical protein
MSTRTLATLSRTLTVALLMAVVGPTSVASAQQTAERYIPIGESPGVSGTSSVIGEIVAVDAQTRAISVATDSGRRTLRMTATTRYWLDRSQRQRPNGAGTFADCSVGRFVEVLPSRDDAGTATWVKIRSD